MIQLTSFFEERTQEFLEQKFLDDYLTECKARNIDGYFGIMMVITDKHVPPLIHIVSKYMYDLLGLKMPIIDVIPYETGKTLPADEGEMVDMNRWMGIDTKGFYARKTNKIYIKNGIHLHKLLPTVFHELTHAYVHNNGICIVDNYKVPTKGIFDFEYFMREANQEEGLCELVMTLMCYHIFKRNEYASNMEAYFLGWRLNVQAFLELATTFRKIKPEADNLIISRLCMYAIITFYKNNNNIYRYVSKVPPDANYGPKISY